MKVPRIIPGIAGQILHNSYGSIDVPPMERVGPWGFMKGADSGKNNLRIRDDFRDLVYWDANIITDSNGSANVTFPMPGGLTEWKIKAWAMHTNYAAEAETSIRCALDFVAQLDHPRFMVEGDELEFSTSVRNHTSNTMDSSVLCFIEGDALSPQSPTQQILNHLESGKERRCDWTLRAEKAGTAEITTTAVTDSASDGMKRSIPVLPHGLLKRGGHGGVLAGTKTKETVQIVIPNAIDPESLEFDLHASPDLLEALTAALPYLADYPYGCTEQTLNRFLPSLVVMQTLQKLGIDSLSATSNMPPDRIALLNPNEILKRAQAGIDRLQEAHYSWKGWGWNMDSSSPEDPLITAWVLRGMHIADHVRGLHIPDRKEIVRDILTDMEEREIQIETSTNKLIFSNTDAFQVLLLSEIGVQGLSRYHRDPYVKASDEENKNLLVSFTDLVFDHADQLSLYGKVLLANCV